MSDANPYIIDADPATFEQDAIERSRVLPVVVDFWAEWCAPCKLLGPVLEGLALEYGGQFVLVKVDTEHAPDVAAGFRVRSIPAVFGLRDGQVVDSFVGALPEPQVRAWIETLLPTAAERLVAEAVRLEPTDAQAAEAKYREALALAPADPVAKTGLARALLALGRTEEAQDVIRDLEARGYLEPEAEKVRAEISLRSHAGPAGGVNAARAAAAANPGDLASRLELAEALAADGHFAESLELCLDLVERDRKGVGESARKAMLSIFQILPADSEIATDARRRLAALLY